MPEATTRATPDATAKTTPTATELPGERQLQDAQHAHAFIDG